MHTMTSFHEYLFALFYGIVASYTQQKFTNRINRCAVTQSCYFELYVCVSCISQNENWKKIIKRMSGRAYTENYLIGNGAHRKI